MAQAHITVGQIEIAIEDEDAGFKPVAKAAFKLLLDVIEKVQPEPDDDEDDDDGE